MFWTGWTDTANEQRRTEQICAALLQTVEKLMCMQEEYIFCIIPKALGRVFPPGGGKIN